jgi:hypothetical protein
MFGLLCVVSLCAGPLDSWHWRNPNASGNRLQGVGANGSRYVAVGEFGTILVSDTGTDWWGVAPISSVTLRAVTWGDGRWVAVGDFGEILTSPDGVEWTWRSTPWFFDLSAVTWGGGLFVAVGENTAILTSPDGVEWTLRGSGTHPLKAVLFANGRFVAAGGRAPSSESIGVGAPRRNPGEPLLLVSDNGTEWTRVEVPVEGQISCLAFGAGRFVGGTTSRRAIVSSNGYEWAAGFEPEEWSAYEFYAMAYVGDRFIASYGSETTLPGQILVSSDGVQWTQEPWTLEGSRDYLSIRSMTTNPEGILGVARGPWYSVEYKLVWSADSRQWQSAQVRLPEIETQPAYAGGRFFLRELSYERPETVYVSSTDGQTWESTVVSETEWFGLPAHGNALWVAGGQQGHVAVSTDAIQWQVLPTGNTNPLLHSAFCAGNYILTGAGGTLLVSADGTNWTRQTVDATNALTAAVWHEGTFAVAETGTARFFTSADSAAWTLGTMPSDVVLIEALSTWEAGFVALARTNQFVLAQVFVSPDGGSWSRENVPAEGVDRIVTGGGWLLAFRGQGSQVFHARHVLEADWSSHRLPWITTLGYMTQSAPAGAVFGQDTFLLTHGWQLLLQSDPLIPTAPRLTQPVGVVIADPASQATLRAIAQGSAPLRFQWLRDGTNLPSATSPFLRLPVGEITGNRITVAVANDLGTAESDTATVEWAEPATLGFADDLSSVRVQGTPRGRYRVEYTRELESETRWSTLGEVQLPSSGQPARVRNVFVPGEAIDSHRFFRAVARP